MSLLDEARSKKPRRGPECGMGRLMGEMSAELAAEVVACLAEPDVSDAALRSALNDRGYNVPTLGVIGTHRRGECKCDG